jgi:hypothetical protein
VPPVDRARSTVVLRFNDRSPWIPTSLMHGLRWWLIFNW